MAKVFLPSRPALVALAIPFLALLACGDAHDRKVFELLGAERTGVGFANTITTSDSLNEQTDVYVYNGAGVAVGDVDNDGLPDIFFAGNMVSSRLYRNRGGMRFEDVTERAGVRTTRWATGVAMADVNDDGFLDIYVGVSGPPWTPAADRANLLFVNRGDGTFAEEGARYGVADTGFTTHAAFLDYDGDGCLDLFLLENDPHDFARTDAQNPGGSRGRTPGSYNQLYRNDCRGHFANVSAAAGILRDAGFGLGVAVADVNADGHPDIYVSNDAQPNDMLYVNDGDGTFTNRAGEWLKHASVAGMGVDVADFNDDGWPDILQVDMMPRELSRRKRMSGYVTQASVADARSRGFRDDYSQNSLQLSTGVTPGGGVLFSEIARLAGVAHTDWSWSALFADFDDDGRKDIFIGNGYPKAVNDLDYVFRIAGGGRGGPMNAAERARLDLLHRLPAYEEPNYVFRNRGDLTFEDRSRDWGIATPSFSYGAAYADLDNDGRLDLVVSNIDAPAFIYHNVRSGEHAGHWLAVKLEGDSPNRRGIGATLVLTAGGKTQYLYQSPYRGYMSTVDDRLHFGLDTAARVDRLEIYWPDGRFSVLQGIDADRMLVVRQRDATARRAFSRPSVEGSPPFEPLRGARVPRYRQQLSSLADFNVQPLLPYEVSHQGPPLAAADVDGDGLDDVYVGGTAAQRGALFLQRRDGTFAASAWTADSGYHDWGATFLDANGDGRPDLYVASGGYALGPEDPLLQDRLYLNQGGGRFARDSAALPAILGATAAVRAADFDGDGKPDLFVGGRLTPREWPRPARSWLLRNEGGRFVDVTAQLCPELASPGGMITDAVWTDFDHDGRVDLVTVGEWMPIRLYRNEGARFRDVTAQMGLAATRGWWYSVAAADLDGDGHPELVAGNLGLNTFTTSKDSLFGVYAADFTGNGRTDVVLTQAIGGKEYPLAGFAPLGKQLYTLSLKYPTYGSFASATMEQLFGAGPLKQALHYEADTFASVVLHNEGGKRFSVAPLPAMAQLSPIRGILVRDVDADGKLDLVVAGNLYAMEPNTTRADAGNGLWLRGDGRGGFVPVPARASGLIAPLDVTGLAPYKTITGVGIIIANAGDSLQAFSIRKR